MDTAQIRQVKELYYMRADSAFAEMAQQLETDGKSIHWLIIIGQELTIMLIPRPYRWLLV